MLPIFEDDSVAVDFAICLSDAGRPRNLRSVNNKHSATACSGEVNSFSLNQTACVAVTLFRLLATSRDIKSATQHFDASKPTPPLMGPAAKTSKILRRRDLPSRRVLPRQTEFARSSLFNSRGCSTRSQGVDPR